MPTKIARLAVSVVLAIGIGSAEAKGCMKGAVVGGAAGHIAGKHGIAGAGAGCAIGHHEANKKAKAARQASEPAAQ